MTVSVARPRVLWVGDGATTSVSLSDTGVPIVFDAQSRFVVKELVTATGVITTLVLGVDYSIDLTSVVPGASTPAILTRIAGALASGKIWAAYRDTPKEQDEDIGGDFSSTDIEAGFDDLAVQAQEINDKADLALKLAVFEDLSLIDPHLPQRISTAVGKAIGINLAGTGFDFFSRSNISLVMGTVTTLSPGASATATITDNHDGSFTLALGLPAGINGNSGNGSGDMLKSLNLSDVASPSTAFTNIKQAATTGATGVVQRATDAIAAVPGDTTSYTTPDQLHKARADVASATTTDLGAVTSNYARITGTVTITSLGTAAAGTWRHVVFSGALTLTHNSSTLIIPGGASITTAAGDVMIVRSEGSGNWRVLTYFKASGLPIVMATTAEAATGTSTTKPVAPAGLFPARADLASATTTSIGAQTTTYVNITGTVTITGFGTIAAGIKRNVRFDAALLLTYNATSLILPGAANITTAQGDTAEFISEGSGNWKCLWYTRAAGTPVVSSASTSKIITRAYGEYAANTDLLTAMPFDDTIPQNTEGTDILDVAITISSAANRIRITIAGEVAANCPYIVCALFKDAVADAICAWAVSGVPNDSPHPIDKVYEYAPSTTGSVTYKLRIGGDATSPILRANGNLSGRKFGGKSVVSMVIEEVVP